MSASLTPPADAPLPLSVYVDPHYGPAILDVNGETIGGIGMDRDLPEQVAIDVARYLVACANAAPGLLAEVARLRAALSDAVDLAAEGLSYTDDFFVNKWDMPARLAAIKAELDKETP